MSAADRRPRDPRRAASRLTFYRACWKKHGQAAWTYADVRDAERAATNDMWALAAEMPGEGTVLHAQAASAAAALPLLVFEASGQHAHACRGAHPWTYAAELAEKIRAVNGALAEDNTRHVREAKAAATLALEPLRWAVFGSERRAMALAMALACEATKVAIQVATRHPDTMAALDELAQSFASWGMESHAEWMRAQKP